MHTVTAGRGAALKEAWDVRQSVRTNMKQMGLSSDPNVTMGIPKTKDTFKAPVAEISHSSGDKAPATPSAGKQTLEDKFPRLAVALRLENESKERKRKTLRLSQMMVDRLGYFIDKYKDDYKAMTRDKLNYDQHTWRQLRAQIKKFMGIPEQWNEYWANLDKEPPQRCIVLEEDENMED
ncbi:hypothetical protein B566_EDAN010751 [Ephemera danica]|nr:hypothetical protein B566_EDAN010751 [Ephemera danica]